MNEHVFSRRALVGIFAAGTISLIAAVIFGLAGPPQGDADSNGADAYSRSALGHRAYREVLQDLEIPVLTSRYHSAKRSQGGVLVVAEPRLRHVPGGAGKFADMLDEAHTVLVVLPKRRGRAEAEDDEWLDEVYPVSREEVSVLLGLIPGEYELHRVGAPAPEVPWESHVLAAEPTIDDPQLVTSDDLEPLVETERGILLGKVTDEAVEEQQLGTWSFESSNEQETDQSDSEPNDTLDVYVLSDPDALANHALDEADNAMFAVSLAEYLRQGAGTIVFDETLHGFESEPAFTRAVFEFPLVLVTINFILLMLVAIWAGMGRFGRPREAEPEIQPGKRFLIDNTARLLQTGGHDTHMLRRLAWALVDQVGRELRAPADLKRWELTRWIDQINERRGLDFELASFMKSIESLASGDGKPGASTLLSKARQLYEWKQDILHGYR